VGLQVRNPLQIWTFIRNFVLSCDGIKLLGGPILHTINIIVFPNNIPPRCNTPFNENQLYALIHLTGC
jgi:hypothetical protein